MSLGTLLLSLHCTRESPADLVKIHFVTEQVWGGPEILHFK